MQLFSCAACGQPVHFDNRSCVRCGHRLAFVPETLSMEALDPAGDPLWTLVSKPDHQARFCANEVNDSATGQSQPVAKRLSAPPAT